MGVLLSDLEHFANLKGLSIISSLSRNEVLESLSDNKSFLENWQEKGFSAEMSYMQRPSDLLCNPDNILKDFNSIITFLVPYNLSPAAKIESMKGYGKVARYAWGDDYHLVIKEILNSFVELLENNGLLSKAFCRVFTDSVPLLERALSASSGLGFIGKSSMLIKPGSGTYFFIAELVTTVEVFNDLRFDEVFKKSSCGSCKNCIDLCPTQAIIKDKIVDSRKCISYLTIEKRGVLSLSEVAMLGDWIFGCDICQEVCPFNNKKSLASIAKFDYFSKTNMYGPHLDLEFVLDIKTSEQFGKIFYRSAIKRAKREGLVRNAMAVVYNQKNLSLVDKLIEIMRFDESEILKSQAKLILGGMADIADGMQKSRIKNSL